MTTDNANAPKVFISRNIAGQAVQILREQGYQVEVWQKSEAPSRTELLASCADAQGLIAMLSDQIDAAFLRQNPKLKVVSNYAVGFNNIDVAVATELDIAIGNTPGVLTEATADIALALMLAACRHLRAGMHYVEQDQWHGWGPQSFLGQSLEGKTLGLIGAGQIGQAFARKAQRAWDMKILYHSPRPKLEFEQQLQAQYCSFKELLAQADIISVHCPLNSQTKNLFDEQAFAQMKKGSVFINTARGEIHCEEALYQALSSQHLMSAGLDVTNPEPMRANAKLLSLPNIFITPHIGSATLEARAAMAALAAHNIIAGLRGAPLPAPVNHIVRSET